MNHRSTPCLDQLRAQKPLVLCLTNFVTMEFTANCLLSLGAAPLMSESEEEIQELLSISAALYVNIGTLQSSFIQRAQMAIELAHSQNLPIVLDPVGAGASALRTHSAKMLAPFANVIRGNASEIMALYGDDATPSGVESKHLVDDAQASARSLAKRYCAVVAVSGETDFICDGEQETHLSGGHALMSQITGMGCSLTAVIAAFCANNAPCYTATIAALSVFNKAGSEAARYSRAPGSFQTAFIDALYHSH